jgi:hypothetical protein
MSQEQNQEQEGKEGRGGRRAGAGRKPSGRAWQRQLTVRVPEEAFQQLRIINNLNRRTTYTRYLSDVIRQYIYNQANEYLIKNNVLELLKQDYADRLKDCSTDLEILTRLADLMEAGEKPMFHRVLAEKTEEFGKRLDMAMASDAYQRLEKENADLKRRLAELEGK